MLDNTSPICVASESQYPGIHWLYLVVRLSPEVHWCQSQVDNLEQSVTQSLPGSQITA